LLLPQDEGNSWESSFRDFLSPGGVINRRLELQGSDIVISSIFEQSPTGLIVLSTDEDVLLINQVAEKVFTYDRVSMPEIKWRELKSRKILCNHDGVPLADEADPLLLALHKRERTSVTIMVKSHDQPGEGWVQITAFPVLRDNGAIIAAVAIILDITDFKGMEDVLYHQATHDPLTGLSNRAYFSASMIKVFARAKRGISGGALLLLDLDGFKNINDTHGHRAGDDLLKKVSGRMCSEVRETDTVARIGGDEFAILLSDIDGVEDLRVVGDIAGRICRSISQPFRVAGKEVGVTASIGISLFPRDGSDEETLSSKADFALYKVKQSGRNGWRFWEERDAPPE
jgi:diguanylate cyclase (GGDEF)-like protein